MDFVVTPWISETEWREVYNMIISFEAEQLLKAEEIIATWQTRVDRLPTGKTSHGLKRFSTCDTRTSGGTRDPSRWYVILRVKAAFDILEVLIGLLRCIMVRKIGKKLSEERLRKRLKTLAMRACWILRSRPKMTPPMGWLVIRFCDYITV